MNSFRDSWLALTILPKETHYGFLFALSGNVSVFHKNPVNN